MEPDSLLAYDLEDFLRASAGRLRSFDEKKKDQIPKIIDNANTKSHATIYDVSGAVQSEFEITAPSCAYNRTT
jgi:hypothetical protein